MPATKADGLLHNTLQSNQNRLGPVVPGDDDLGVPGKHRELFVAALLQGGRRQCPGDGSRTTQLSLHHFVMQHLMGNTN